MLTILAPREMSRLEDVSEEEDEEVEEEDENHVFGWCCDVVQYVLHRFIVSSAFGICVSSACIGASYGMAALAGEQRIADLLILAVVVFNLGGFLTLLEWYGMRRVVCTDFLIFLSLALLLNVVPVALNLSSEGKISCSWILIFFVSYFVSTVLVHFLVLLVEEHLESCKRLKVSFMKGLSFALALTSGLIVNGWLPEVMRNKFPAWAQVTLSCALPFMAKVSGVLIMSLGMQQQSVDSLRWLFLAKFTVSEMIAKILTYQCQDTITIAYSFCSQAVIEILTRVTRLHLTNKASQLYKQIKQASSEAENNDKPLMSPQQEMATCSDIHCFAEFIAHFCGAAVTWRLGIVETPQLATALCIGLTLELMTELFAVPLENSLAGVYPQNEQLSLSGMHMTFVAGSCGCATLHGFIGLFV